MEGSANRPIPVQLGGLVTWWISQDGMRAGPRMPIFWRGMCVESVSRPIVNRASVLIIVSTCEGSDMPASRPAKRRDRRTDRSRKDRWLTQCSGNPERSPSDTVERPASVMDSGGLERKEHHHSRQEHRRPLSPRPRRAGPGPSGRRHHQRYRHPRPRRLRQQVEAQLGHGRRCRPHS